MLKLICVSVESNFRKRVGVTCFCLHELIPEIINATTRNLIKEVFFILPVKAKEWGLDQPGFSNGSAYGDLDNDGDLDLVVNNVNMPCFVYRNQSRQQHPENGYVKVSLQGEGKNRFGIGAKVTVYYNHTLAYQEQMPMRGFESTVDARLNFGLGKVKQIDSVVVQWPC